MTTTSTMDTLFVGHARLKCHAAAGARRTAAQRAYREAAEMRRRADFFRNAKELHAGTGLGDWYAKLHLRFDDMESQLLAEGCEIEDGYGEGVLS